MSSTDSIRSKLKKDLKYKPNPKDFLHYIQNHRENFDLSLEQKGINHSILSLTTDTKMMKILEIIQQVAHTDVPLLISGEPGVGKKFIANIIHSTSCRADRAICYQDCSLLTSDEGSSHEEGFFEQKAGIFESAHGSTLLLDKISELNLPMQENLLKTLKNKKTTKMNTRIIAISNKDLGKLVEEGRFQQDLFYKLCVFHIEVPPLREKISDINNISHYFLLKHSKNNEKKQMVFSESAKKCLLKYEWPDNIRELEKVIQRAIVLCEEDVIQEQHLNLKLESSRRKEDWIQYLPIGEDIKRVETQFILETLKFFHGNRTHAARTLGISLRTLRNKINEFHNIGIQVAPVKNKRTT